MTLVAVEPVEPESVATLGHAGGMPDPVDRRRTDTRQRIVDAALRLFGELGYDRTTIAEIERAVGLRPGGGGLYRHFPSKEAVLLEAVEQYRNRVRDLRAHLADPVWIGSVTDGVGRSRPRSRAGKRERLETDLQTIVGELGRFLSVEAPIVRLNAVVGALPATVRHVIGDSWDDGYGILADVFVRHGVAADRAKLLAVHALGALDHYVAHAAAWDQLPSGVPLAVFVSHWAATWSDIATNTS